jgi:hypothetical protein
MQAGRRGCLKTPTQEFKISNNQQPAFRNVCPRLPLQPFIAGCAERYVLLLHRCTSTLTTAVMMALVYVANFLLFADVHAVV